MDADLSHDAFLGGKLHLWQPRTGYRAGVDPVLLAASVQAKAGQSVLDLGCGAGAAALCLGARVAGLTLTGVERQPFYAELARRNGLTCLEADIAALPAALRQQSFDHVLANPPYFDRAAGHAATDPGREGALGEQTPLNVWVDVAARRLKPKGYLHMVHRADRLPDVLVPLQGRLGSIVVQPLAPRVGRDATLILIRARKEGRSPTKLSYPIVLHEGASHEGDKDSYLPAIADVLRQGAPLIW